MEKIDMEEAYRRSLDILKKCATPQGFVASVTQKDNYFRVFSRDAVIVSLAALPTGDAELIECCKNSLLILGEHQGEHGEIPSNVALDGSSVSYGGTAGRVDATIWFVIGVSQYFKHTQDKEFLKEMFPIVQKCIWLMGAWEFNQKGLIYVPQTGDWADEYIQHGYVLYDQMLYLKALEEYAYLMEIMGEDNKKYIEKAKKMKNLLQVNFWINHDEEIEIDNTCVYHEILLNRGKKDCHVTRPYWMSFFSPVGYGYRFDGVANVFASLFGLANDGQRNLVDDYIADHFQKDTEYVIPAFFPVIHPEDKEWEALQVAFSFSFKNKPFEFHNGGLWPMITGFYVLDLALRGKTELAEYYLNGINTANKKSDKQNEEWGFFEFINGQTHQPQGMKTQGWSAGAGVMGYLALKSPEKIFL